MATRLNGECRIAGVQVGEIRVREIGRSPSVMAKMALMTDDGESAGQYIQHMFSERTAALLRQLIASMEDDAATMLTKQSPTESDYDTGGDYDDNDDDENEGMTFR